MPLSPASPAATATAGGVLRLLSLNIQVGLNSSQYRHYLTQAWRHVLPSRGVRATLDAIAQLAQGYDVVALQEADAGSLRTAQLNQVDYLAARAGLAHWEAAVNRDLGPFAQHCLGCLSRFPLHQRRYHALPGRLPGRGALELQIAPAGYAPLRIFVVHLALSRGARFRQLDFLGSLLEDAADAVIVGDFNCAPAELEAHPALLRRGLRAMNLGATFPSWRPQRAIDHLLVTPGIDVIRSGALDLRLSDHLPIGAEIRLKPLRRRSNR
jgi:endonuclease/exonuclease/phosphatase family metal-dependent hydrolase